METRHCICGLLPVIKTRTRVSIVMPWSESCRPSNTGRLASLVLPNSEVRLRGEPRHPFDPSGLLDTGRLTYLLFPTENATVLTRKLGLDASCPITLVVPDGTWRQARRVCRREDSLSGLQAVRLPPGPASIYRLRRARQPGQLCTYESISRALSILEDPSIEERMMRPFQVAVDRQLQARGRRPC
jgi:DTW domain-containing protein YfiP